MVADLATRLAAMTPAQRSLLLAKLLGAQTGDTGAAAGTAGAAGTAPPNSEPIAVIGIGCRLPGGIESPGRLWRALREGTDLVGPTPGDRWDVDAWFDEDPSAPGTANTRCGAYLDDIAGFDRRFFAVPRTEAERMDPQQRIVLETTWRALEDGGIPAECLAGSRTGVFIASMTDDYTWMQLTDPRRIDAHTGTGTQRSILSNRVSYEYDLRGPSVSVDSACSSSLTAVHLAVRSLRSGESDLAIAGGVNVIASPLSGVIYSKLGMMSPAGRCQTFDAAADGFVRGEGCGVVVLKPLSAALTDGDPVWGVIRGTAIGQDGRTSSITAPNGPAQAEVIRAALRDAGIAPVDIGLVETHGTGTALGDPVELEALTGVLGEDRADGRVCSLGALKTNLGHLEAAAGVVGLIKVVLSLWHRELAPVLHLRDLNPHIELDRRFAIPRELDTLPEHVRFGSVSSFGFGGSLAHAVLEAPPTEPPTEASEEDQPRLLLLSAKDERALAHLADEYADLVERPDAPAWPDVVHTAARRRTHHEHRLAVVAADGCQAARRLRQAARSGGVVAGGSRQGDAAPVAFVFPGQGGAFRGMGAGLYAADPVFRRVLDECDEEFRPRLGWSLAEALYGGEPADLDTTTAAQPALFAVQVALAGTWRAHGVRPAAVVGQSLGEVSAAYVAGALDLADAAAVVCARSRLMGELEGTGTAGVVELAAEQAREQAERFGGDLGIAGLLGPTTTLVSGTEEAVGALVAELAERGVFARVLRGVRVPFHSPRMALLAAGLPDRLGAIRSRPAELAMVSSVTGRPVDGEQLDAGYWADNVALPFQLGPPVEELIARGVGLAVEIAPHPALGHAVGSLAGRRLPVVPTLRRDAVDLEAFLEAVGAVHAHGGRVDLAAVVPAGRCVRLPGYPWQRERAWLAGDPAQVPVAAATPDTPEISETPASVLDHQSPGDVAGRLAAMWSEALDVPVGRIEPDLSFFSLGGNSLKAFALVRRISEEFGARLGLDELPDLSTLTAMAAAIEQRRDGRRAEAPAADTRQAPPADDERYEPFPLMPIQQAYWVGRSDALVLGAIGARYYVEYDADGLDLDRLEAAWNRLVERHEMLRAVVDPDGRQRVLATVPRFVLDAVDVSAVDERARTRRLAELRAELSHQVSPADRWPLFTLRAARLPHDRVRLYLGFDMLFCDGHSIGLLSEELRLLYESPATALPELKHSFRDFALAHHARRGGPEFEQARRYWRDRGAELPAPPEVPVAAKLEDVGRDRFVRRSARLDRDRWRRLCERAGAHGLSPSCVVLASYAEAIGTWSTSSRFSLNVTTFNLRAGYDGSEGVVGDFTSTVPLAVDARSGKTFAGRADAIQRRLWSDLAHSQVDGTEVLAMAAAQRDDDAFELGVPFVFTSLLGAEADPSGTDPVALSWLGERAFGVSQTPQVLMDLQVMTDRGELVVDFDVVADAFPEGLVDGMFGALRDLLHRLADEEDGWNASPLALLPAAQRAVRTEVNRTDAAVPAGGLHEPFLRVARTHPERVAVRDADGEVTYRDLDELSEGVAERLAGAGAHRGELVGVRMDKGWRQVAAVLGVLKAGAAYVPIAPDLPVERCAHIVRQSGCRLVLQEPGRAPIADLPGLDYVEVSGTDRRPPADRPSPHPDEIAYVIFTSGSTGVPKGVVIHHRGALNTVLDINERFGVGPDDRVLALSSLSFDLSVWDVFGVLAAGGTIVLPDPAEVLDPQHWADLVARDGVTVWNSVPALFELFVGHLAAAGVTAESLRLVMMSGDWIPLTLPDRAREVVPEAAQISLGGATEGSIWSIHYPIGEVRPDWRSVPYGFPLRNQRMYVLNDELEMCPDWVPGELYIGGIGVAKGYQGDEERTRGSFFVHPRTGEWIYRTGDLGRWLPDGCIEFLGRDDLQVKIQGYRIELEEIEVTLFGAPDVVNAAVVVVGERDGARRLAAHVAPAPGATLDQQRLRDHLADRLPPYMVPPTVRLWERLPLNANGKVDRGKLVESSASPAPSGTAGTQAAVVAPEVERTVLDVIGRHLEHVDVDPGSRLADTGAASIDIIRVAEALQQTFGRRPRMRDLFARLTVRDLVAFFAADAAPREQAAEHLDDLDAQVILDPEERRRFRTSRHDLRRVDPGQPRISCVPSEGDGVLSARGTTRSPFRTGTMPYDRLAALLGALREDAPSHRRAYGSAGALYPVQVYVLVPSGRIDGLPAGAYYFDPVANELAQLNEDREDGPVHLPENRELGESAAFTVFLVGRLDAIAPLYGARSRDFVLIEAGAMTQELERTAAAAGLALRQIGDLDTSRTRRLLDLTGTDEVVHVLVGGVPSAEPAPDAKSLSSKDSLPDAARVPRAEPVPAGESEPFPLSDTQQALWVGRAGEFELGGVSTHSYLEFAPETVDVDRLNAAWDEVIARHAMLRAVVRPDALQEVLREVPAYRVEVVDLRGVTDAEVDTALERTRQEMSHQVLATDEWPLVQTRVLLTDSRAHLAMSVDSQLLDAFSVVLMLRDLHHAYQAPGSLPPAPEISFREYLERERAGRSGPEWEQARRYWLDMLPTLPAAPRLPVTRDPETLAGQRFVRKQLIVEPRRWAALRSRATARGLTASAVLCTAFCAVLRQFAAADRFTLNLTLFDRQPEYGDVQELVGQLNRTALLPVDLSGREGFEQWAHHVQDQLWSSLEHRRYSGVLVLRELSARWGAGTAPIMPVVFTSMLDLPRPDDADDWLDWLGEPVVTLTQTPQVWIEHGVLERGGSLQLYWDAVEGLLPPAVLDAMFDAYRRLVESLCGGDDAADEAGAASVWRGAAPHAVADAAVDPAPVAESVRSVLFPASRVAKPALHCGPVTWTFGELDRYLDGADPGTDAPAGERARRLLGVLADLRGAEPDGMLPVPGHRGRLRDGYLARLLLAHADRMGLTAADRVWPAGCVADPSTGMALCVALAAGACVVVPADDAAPADATVYVTDAVDLADRLRDPDWAPPGDTRLVLITGTLAPHAAGPLLARAPGVRVLAVFGPADLGGTGLVTEPAAGEYPSRWTPVAGVRPLVLDAQRRQRPAGVPGRLWFELDPDDARPGGMTAREADHGRRVVATDLRARRDGRSLDGLGALGDGGADQQWWESEVLLTAHPSVHDCAVVPAADGATTVAYVCGAEVDPDGLRAHLAERLPPFLVPAVVQPVAEIPRNRAGHVEVERLPAPRVRPAAAEPPSVGPGRDDVRQKVAEAVTEVLGRPLEMEGNLFDQGATSVHLIQIRRSLRTELSADVPVVDMFRYPSIAALAAHVQSRTGAGSGPAGEPAANGSNGNGGNGSTNGTGGRYGTNGRNGTNGQGELDRVARAARERAARRRSVRR